VVIPQTVAENARGRDAPTHDFDRGDVQYGISHEAWVVHRNGGLQQASSQTEAHSVVRRGGGIALPEGDRIQVGAF
jgi:hypothetical protein